MPLILKAAGNRIYNRSRTNGIPRYQIYPMKEWRYVKDRSAIANLFTFDYPEPCLANGQRYIPRLRDDIGIYKTEADYADDNRYFGGLVTNFENPIIQNVRNTFKEQYPYHVQYSFECSSYDIILDKELRQPQKADQTWQQLIMFLLDTFFQGQISSDYSLIANPIAAPPIKINNGTMRDLLKAMRQLTGYDYYVDNYKRLNVFLATSKPASFEVTDSPSKRLFSWDTVPTVSQEGRNLFNIIRQPFLSQIGIDDWTGETFTGKGDPKGQVALPLLRTPTNIDETTYIDDRFDGNVVNANNWIEIDDNSTQHVDYPNQGHIFPSNGQLQVLGGSSSFASFGLLSQDFYAYVESAYIVQEFQLTSSTGNGYIACLTDGGVSSTSNIKAGLLIQDGVLKALDGTVLLASLDTTQNYIFWVIMTLEGWQYDIQGGIFATKQTLRIEPFEHLTDYKLAPIINGTLRCSINSVRFRQSDRGVTLEVNGLKKVVGLEQSDTDLPDIDAFLNIDETPATIKFRAATDIYIIASVVSDTQITVSTTSSSSSGMTVRQGNRLLIGDDIIEQFDGRECYVSSVSGMTLNLLPPGLSGMSIGQTILVNTTLPEKDAKILVKYGYSRMDEATAYDQESIDKYKPISKTLEQQDQLKRYTDAVMQAEEYLKKYKDGILTIDMTSNNILIPIEPQAMTSVSVKLNSRPDKINKQVVLQRVEVTPIGGNHYKYSLHMESADPVTPLQDGLRKGALIIGADGDIRFSINLTDQNISDDTELSIRSVSSAYIKWGNPEGRKYGEFKWKP